MDSYPALQLVYPKRMSMMEVLNREVEPIKVSHHRQCNKQLPPRTHAGPAPEGRREELAFSDNLERSVELPATVAPQAGASRSGARSIRLSDDR